MKIAIHCFEFREENLRRQPWRYVWELAKFFRGRGEEVYIVTDRQGEAPAAHTGGIATIHLPREEFYHHLAEHVGENDFQLLFDVQGLHSFLNNSRLRILKRLPIPIVGVLTSPVYVMPELLRVSITEWFTNGKYLARLMLGAMLPPNWLINRMQSVNALTVVLSNHSMQRIIDMGMDARRIISIPPGRDPGMLNDSQAGAEMRKSPENGAVRRFLYLGSPLTLRGSDTVLKAFAGLCRNNPNTHLTMLCRTEHEELQPVVRKLKRYCGLLGIADKTAFISGVLPSRQVDEYIGRSDVILQPFKIIISEMPLAILEGMTKGKAVISTSVDGIPELLANERGVVVPPGDSLALARAMKQLVHKPERIRRIGANAREYVLHQHPDWDTTFSRLAEKLSNMNLIPEEVFQ